MPPLGRILFEAAPDDCHDSTIERTWQPRPVDVGFQDVGHHLSRARPIERAPPGQQLVRDTAERKNIASLIGLKTFGLLGRHISRRADNDARRRQIDGRLPAGVADKFCEAEVEYLHPAVGGQLDVGGLEIAMTDSPRMSGLERIKHLLEDRQRLLRRERTAAHPIGERVALDKFEDQIRDASGLFEVVDGRNVGVIDRCDRLGFAVKARETIGIVGVGFRQDFDRDLPFQLTVVSEEHFAHPARAEQGQDFVRTEASANGDRQAGLAYVEARKRSNGRRRRRRGD